MVQTAWLEVVRVILGVLILLAISTLYRIFKNTKIIAELNIITLGFGMYLLQAALGAWEAFGHPLPYILHLRIDVAIEAAMYLVFFYALIRLRSVFDYRQVEKKIVSVLKQLLR